MSHRTSTILYLVILLTSLILLATEVFSQMTSMVWEKRGVVMMPSATWEGTVNGEPNVLFEEGKFKMWYRGNKGLFAGIGYAESLDGTNWTKLPLTVDYNASLIYPYIVKNGSEYLLYACHNDYMLQNGREVANTSKYSLFKGLSGRQFTFISDLLVGETWDSELGNLCVWREGDVWFMLYEARTEHDSWKIGLANSTDGIRWTKYEHNPVLASSRGSGGPFLQRINDTYYLWYHQGGEPTDIARALSTDLKHWLDFPANPVLPRTLPEEGVEKTEGQVGDICLIEVLNTTYAFYASNSDQTGHNISLATSPNRLAQIVSTCENAFSVRRMYQLPGLLLGDKWLYVILISTGCLLVWRKWK